MLYTYGYMFNINNRDGGKMEQETKGKVCLVCGMFYTDSFGNLIGCGCDESELQKQFLNEPEPEIKVSEWD